MKYAVIIKHPGRDFDYRVDIYEAPEEGLEQEVRDYAQRQMLGPFEVIAVTTKISGEMKLAIKTVTILEKA